MKIRKNKFQRIKKDFFHLVKYSIGYLTGGAGYFASIYAFTEYAHIHYLLSTIISFFISITIAYTITKRFAFNQKIRENYFKEWFKYALTGGLVAPLNLGIIYLLTENSLTHYLLSAFIAGAICFGLKYIGDVKWSFRERLIKFL